MTELDRLKCPAPANDRCLSRPTGDAVPSVATIFGTFGVALMLSSCAASVRPGPVVDPAAPAPFTIRDGPTPTQAQAQAAVDGAISRNGLSSVFPNFVARATGRIPTRITLFACGPVSADSIPRRRVAKGVSVTCHVDVLDHDGGLVGRMTMRFARQQGAWVLVEDREREFDAR